ncbi:MAG: MBL fold metallo-hydrolase RNA specificity domain-containing protein [Ferruginibacter sp.]
MKRLFLVHGEYDVQQAFKMRLASKGFDNIDIPGLHETVTLA